MQELSEKSKPVKRTMTEKQKAARLANLERGRKKRLESIKLKKEAKPQEEYDLSSNSSNSDEASESDFSDAFIISKKKKMPKTKLAKPRKLTFNENNGRDDNLRNDVDELKNMIVTLANLQKKQNKARKQTKKASGGTKIVVLPQNTPASRPNDNLMEALRKSLL